MKIVKILAFLVFFPYLCFSGNQRTNLQWVESNLAVLFDSLEISRQINLNDTKIEVGAVKGEQSGFIKNKIINYLEGSADQYFEQDSLKIFRVEQFHTEIVYQQNSYGMLGLQSGYFRENHIEFKGWIENAEGKILKSIDVIKTVTDSLEADNIPFLDKSPYSFSKGRIQDLSLWSRVIEPLLVTSTIGVMVYLLYSVRS